MRPRSRPRRAVRLALPLLAASALAGCAAPQTADPAEQERVARSYAGAQRYLRVAVHATPLFGDRDKVMITAGPPSEVELLLGPRGEPIPPPAPERVLPPGTPVRVEWIEFPAPWTVRSRVVLTPRYHPWAYLSVPGDPRPHVLVLSQLARTLDDVRAEVEPVLSEDDPSAELAALPEAHRAAVLRKEVVEGMSARTLELAWGQPERKLVDRPNRTEEWFWPGGKRSAFLREDRVERWTAPARR
jgi:hypothetical protein